MGVFLQYNDSVFVKVGAEARFVTEKIFAGNTVYGLIPVFQSDIIIIIAFQPLDRITFAGFVCFCLHPTMGTGCMDWFLPVQR